MNGRPDRGSTTAELAVAMPALILMLMFGLTGVSSVIARLRCFDAARDAALAESRGDSGELAARRGAPPGATISVQNDGVLVRVAVRVPVHPLGRHMPGFAVEGTAVAAVEPTR